MEIEAKAKINIFLNVGSLREDSFHSIASIFQKISLADCLEVNARPADKFSCKVTGLENVRLVGESSIEKAARLWSMVNGMPIEAEVKIVKKIPSLSGLGGGSSDAASVLLALERIFGFPSSPVKLLEIGAKVGSDVPFFLADCNAAYVSGRGEIVEPIKANKKLSGYLIFPDYSKKGTAEAYALLDKRERIPRLLSEDEAVEEYEKDVSEWTFTNDFEVLYCRPDIETEDGERLFLTGSGNSWVYLTEKKLPTKSNFLPIKLEEDC